MQTVIDVLTANILTIWIAYGFWRLKRDESLSAILILLAPLLIVGLIAYSVGSERVASRTEKLQGGQQALSMPAE